MATIKTKTQIGLSTITAPRYWLVYIFKNAFLNGVEKNILLATTQLKD